MQGAFNQATQTSVCQYFVKWNENINTPVLLSENGKKDAKTTTAQQLYCTLYMLGKQKYKQELWTITLERLFERVATEFNIC